jgi:aminoglycoside 6-adenylyltransferase
MLMKADNFYRDFERAFTSWAEATEDVRAAFIVGSRSRVDHPADEWADLDIILYANNSNLYLHEIDWLKSLGNIWVTFTYQTSGGEPERLTLFEGGFQVDIVFLTSESLNQLVKDRITPENFRRGVKVLVDKDNVSSYIVPSDFKPVPAPPIDGEAFVQVVNMFFFSSLYIAKQIARGELWTAKARENDLRGLLLQMLEWHAKALHGNDYDVWHGGRFLHEWIDQMTLKELCNIFTQYKVEDCLRGLLASISLFRRISVETADRLQLEYPTDTDHHITNWIRQNIELSL